MEQAEATQHLLAEQARHAERTRIAQEMHDVLAHRVSMMALQAGGLEVRPDLPPAEVRETAGLIRSTARQALEELRGIIGVLRDGGSEEASRAPQPSLPDIARLVEDSRRAGMNVELDMQVEVPEAAPAALGRDTYRIVREALTNVSKHAAGAAATVSVSGRPGDGLQVIVRNRLPPHPAAGVPLPGVGLGLAGLAERIAPVGRNALARTKPRRGLRGGRCAALAGMTAAVSSSENRGGPPLRVLLVDDDPLVRAGLRVILSSADDLVVVGEAADGAQAVAVASADRPEVVLMDIRMPGVDGITATERICALPGPPKVIVLTTFHLDEYVFGALRAGASGFLLKDTPPADIVHAVRLVAAGEAMLSPAVTRTLIGHFSADTAASRRAAAGRSLQALTERER